MDSIIPLIEGKNAKERAKVKAREISKIPLKGQFTKNGLRVKIHSIEEIEGGVQIMAQAWKDGKQLGFGIDGSVDIERFRIFNPPILVEDKNGDIIEEREYPEGIKISRTLKEDPKKAIQQAMQILVLETGKEDAEIEKGKIGNTTTTFYPTSGDGYVGFGTSKEINNWSTARNVTDASPNGSANLNSLFVQSVYNSGIYGLWRCFLPFDTSALSGQSVTSATLRIVRSADSGGGNTRSWALVCGTTQASTSTLATTDFDDCGSINSPTEGATRKSVGDWASDGAASSFTLNANGIANINTGGVSKFGIRCGTKDIDNSAPSDNRWQAFEGSGASGTANDPQLIVVHVAATSGLVGNERTPIRGVNRGIMRP